MNIYHIVKKQNLDLFQLQDMVHLQNLKERRLGSLPIDWLKNVKQDEYAKVTDEVDRIFTTFSQKSSDEKYETLSGITAELVRKLKKVLRRNDIKMKFIGNGYFKECSKLTVGKFEYALITMFEKFGYVMGDEQAFGKYFEPQAIFFTYKKMPHGRMAKPFMAKFSTDYYEYGYMLNKFIDEKNKSRAKTHLNPLRSDYREYSIPDSKNKGNMINNIIVDAGGIVKNRNYIKDKTFRKNLNIFLDRIYKDFTRKENLLNNQKCDDYALNTACFVEKFLSEQIDKGVDIYKEDLRELLKSLDKEQQIYAKKLVRRLKKVHKLKCELKADNKYDEYKAYLEKDSNHRYIFGLLAKELEV